MKNFTLNELRESIPAQISENPVRYMFPMWLDSRGNNSFIRAELILQDGHIIDMRFLSIENAIREVKELFEIKAYCIYCNGVVFELS
jgi:hypothetical protein